MTHNSGCFWGLWICFFRFQVYIYIHMLLYMLKFKWILIVPVKQAPGRSLSDLRLLSGAQCLQPLMLRIKDCHLVEEATELAVPPPPPKPLGVRCLDPIHLVHILMIMFAGSRFAEQLEPLQPPDQERRELHCITKNYVCFLCKA